MAEKPVEEYFKDGKCVILFQSMGNAPTLKNNKFYLSASNNFQSIINFIRKQLKYQASDNLYLFINNSFQPHPEEIVLDLFKCFHVHGRLIVNYATTIAYG